MDWDLELEIRRRRRLLQNPYAHLNADGEFDAVRGPLDLQSKIRRERYLHQNPWAYLDDHGNYSASRENDGDGEHSPPLIDVDEILNGQRKGGRFSKNEIETIVRRLQMEIWRNRKDIWSQVENVDPMNVLEPAIALKCLGYKVCLEETLGQYSERGEHFEVAGSHDSANRVVNVSRRFQPAVRNFTTAHELAHAVLHVQSGLHRDRPLDGTPGAGSRTAQESEADAFAAYFLMPAKQVRIEFRRRFLTECFSLDDATAFALGADNLSAAQERCGTFRNLARELARAELYNGVHFESLAKHFRVSVEPMAIRLEELNLIKLLT